MSEPIDDNEFHFSFFSEKTGNRINISVFTPKEKNPELEEQQQMDEAWKKILNNINETN